jgi:hypothetical protein
VAIAKSHKTFKYGSKKIDQQEKNYSPERSIRLYLNLYGPSGKEAAQKITEQLIVIKIV